VIQFEGVTAGYEGKDVLQGASLDCGAGKVTAIVGPSGSGKSTVLRIIMGFLRARSGKVIIENEDVTELPEREWVRVRRKMGMVFQHNALFDSLTIAQNVGFYLHYVERQSWPKIRPQVLKLLAELGLEDSADKLPGQLSGGMQRRVALARSLIYRPTILLYDEPTTGLDPHATEVVTSLISEMNERYQVTSVIVSHDLPSVHDIADHIVLIDKGYAITVGEPRQLLLSDDERIETFSGGWRRSVLAYAEEIAAGRHAPRAEREIHTLRQQEEAELGPPQ
jgi:phospholipid/cholesterol/gamma-HCH transport system ATP-binding protein